VNPRNFKKTKGRGKAAAPVGRHYRDGRLAVKEKAAAGGAFQWELRQRGCGL